MTRIRANGIDVEAEARGPEGGPTVLLIRGLGSQMIHWPATLIDRLVGEGFRVVSFDNRDAGLSQRCPEGGYGLEDMAEDAIGVLDAFGVAAAHLFGISMGGRIAQLMALRAPDRVLSATLVMTSSGAPDLPGRDPEVQALLFERPAPDADRAAVIERTLHADRVFGSPGFPFDEAERRALIERAYDRAFDPDGVARQGAAVIASFGSDLWRELERLRLPVAVVHGTDDAILPVAHGRDLAARIPGAEYAEIRGMGHDLEGDIARQAAEAFLRAARRAA